MTKNRNKNLILVSLDSLRADCITAYKRSPFVDSNFKKGAFSTSPLDALIRKGTYFTNAISAAPYTTASHAAYFTGKWPLNNGIYEFFNRRLVVPTIFSVAKKQGYKTIFQTDFPVILGSHLGFSQDVDTYVVEDELKALKALKSKSKKNNVVAFFHFGGIHYPYGFHKLKFAPEDYPKKVHTLEKKYQIDRGSKLDDILDESYRNARDQSFLLRYKRIIDHLYGNKKYDDLHELYLEGIMYFFRQRLKRFLKEIVEFVDRTDSILVIFADHGESWSDDSRGHANSILDSVLRVPVMMYGSGVPKQKISSLIRTIDVVPTAARHIGLEFNDTDGVPVDLQRPQSVGDRTAFAQVWRVGDKKRVFDHQQKILKKNSMIRPLKTSLQKEVVYNGEYALTREHTKEGIEKTLYKNTKDSLTKTLQNSKIINSLSSKLSAYSKKRKSGTRRITKVSTEIAEKLRGMGYNI